MRKIILTFCVATMLLASCTTNPLDKKVNKENPDKDFIELREALVIDDYNMLTAFFFLKGISGEDMSDITYGELLEEAKQFEKEEAKKAQLKKEEKNARYEKIAREILEKEGLIEKE